MLAFIIFNAQGMEALNIVDYMMSDYALALTDSVEWVEMVQLAERLGDLLDGEYAPYVDSLRILVEGRAPAHEVVFTLENMRKELIRREGISPYPMDYPDLGNGRVIYASRCAVCHGERGDGMGEVEGLDPPPASFLDRWDLTPFRVFNVLHFGLPGMPAFRDMGESDMWDVAFYVISMKWRDVSSSDTLYLSTYVLSTSSDSHLLHLGYSRKQVAFVRHNPVPPDTLTLILGTLDYIERLIASGDHDRAYSVSMNLYLNYVEPVEKGMKNGSSLDVLFIKLRGAISSRKPFNEIAPILDSIRTIFREDESYKGFVGPALSAFVILLREGLEAILLISIMLSLAYRYSRRMVVVIHAGWISALIAGLLTYRLLSAFIGNLSVTSEVVEGATSLFASGILLYVALWFSGGDFIKRFRDDVGRTLGRGAVGGAFLLSFLVVYREIFETVMFYTALIASSGVEGVLPGFLAGVVSLILIAYMIMKLHRRLPLKGIFSVTTFVILMMAVIFAGKGIKELQEAGIVPVSIVDFVPHIEILGIYPTLQSLMAQFAVVLIVFLVMIFRRRRFQPG